MDRNKVRFMNIDELKNLDPSSITYMTFTDGTVAIVNSDSESEQNFQNKEQKEIKQKGKVKKNKGKNSKISISEASEVILHNNQNMSINNNQNEKIENQKNIINNEKENNELIEENSKINHDMNEENYNIIQNINQNETQNNNINFRQNITEYENNRMINEINNNNNKFSERKNENINNSNYPFFNNNQELIEQNQENYNKKILINEYNNNPSYHAKNFNNPNISNNNQKISVNVLYPKEGYGNPEEVQKHIKATKKKVYIRKLKPVLAQHFDMQIIQNEEQIPTPIPIPDPYFVKVVYQPNKRHISNQISPPLIQTNYNQNIPTITEQNIPYRPYITDIKDKKKLYCTCKKKPILNKINDLKMTYRTNTYEGKQIYNKNKNYRFIAHNDESREQQAKNYSDLSFKKNDSKARYVRRNELKIKKDIYDENNSIYLTLNDKKIRRF